MPLHFQVYHRLHAFAVEMDVEIGLLRVDIPQDSGCQIVDSTLIEEDDEEWPEMDPFLLC